jgi:hypothetical protein
MQTIEVSRRLAIWTIVGVCALSAAIGSSITLLAETGPPGKQGEAGPRGPRGREGPEGVVEGPNFGFLESEIEGVAEELGDLGATEARVRELEQDLIGTEETVGEICLELEMFCTGLHPSG